MSFVEFFRKYRNVTVINIGIFMSMIGFGMIMPLLPQYARTMGASMVELGFMASMFAITRTILLTPSGVLSDRYGRKIMLVVGFLLYSVDMFLYSLADSVILIILFRGFQGIASAMMWPSASALIADTVDKREMGRAMSYFSVATDLGFIFGPSFGGVLQDLFGYRAPFLVSGVIMLLITILLSLWIKEGIREKRESPKKKGWIRNILDNLDMVRESPHSRTLFGLMISSFIFVFGFALIEPLLPVYAAEKVSASGTEIGIAFTLAGMVRVVIAPLSGSLTDRIGRRRPIVWGGIFASIFTFPMALIQTPLQMISTMGIRTAGWAFSGPPTQALMADIVEKDQRGRMFGFFGSVQGMGMIMGPIAGGFLYDFWGGEISFVATGILSLIGSLILFRMIEEPKG